MQIKRFRRGLGRRPCVIPAPGICAGFKDISLGQACSLAFKVVLKELELDLCAKELRGPGAKLYVAKMIAFSARPAAMHPWANHHSVWRAGVVLVNGVKRLERTGEVFRIKPSAHNHHGALDIFH